MGLAGGLSSPSDTLNSPGQKGNECSRSKKEFPGAMAPAMLCSCSLHFQGPAQVTTPGEYVGVYMVFANLLHLYLFDMDTSLFICLRQGLLLCSFLDSYQLCNPGMILLPQSHKCLTHFLANSFCSFQPQWRHSQLFVC